MKKEQKQTAPVPTVGSPMSESAKKEDLRTVWSVLRSKFLDSLEKNGIGDLAKAAAWKAFRAVASVAVFAAMFDVRHSVEIAVEAVKFCHYAIPKGLGALVLIYGYKTWLSAGKWAVDAIFGSVSEAFEREVPEGDTVAGIPVSEITDFLFKNKGFSREDFCKDLGVSKARHAYLAEGMEKVGILVRGERNAVLLSPTATREDVVSILANVDDNGFDKLKCQIQAIKEKRVREEKKLNAREHEEMEKKAAGQSPSPETGEPPADGNPATA